MFYVSKPTKKIPTSFKTPLEKQVYEVLNKLDIPFERVENDDAITMDDCIAIDKALNMKTVKTLFLCNRQKTDFYMFVTPGDKPFVTKDFSKALGISRVSFAPAEYLDKMLGTKVGATTIFSCINDSDNIINLVIDSEVLENDSYGCTDGTATCYMKLSTDDILNKLLPFCNHTPTIIEV